MDVQGDNMMEQAMLQLINDGRIKRHLKRATLVYKTKRDFFEKVITEHLSDKINFHKQEGGLAFWLVPKQPTDLVSLSKLLLQEGIQIISPSNLSF